MSEEPTPLPPSHVHQATMPAPVEVAATAAPARPRPRVRLAALFAAAPGRPLTLAGVLGATTAVAAAAAICLLRIVGPGPFNVIWAEDASNFLSDAYLRPVSDNLFDPINGYYLLYGRILAEFASLFPVQWGAGVLTGMSAVSSAVLALIVYVASGQLLRHPVLRAIAGFSVITIAVGYGIGNQVAPLHFVMVYTAFWCLMWTPASRVGRVVQFFVLGLTALSTILVVFLLPLAVLRLWANRDRYSVAMVVTLIPGLALQAFGLFFGDSSRANISHPRLDPLWAVSSFVTWGLPFGLTGENGLPQAGLYPDGYHTGGGTGRAYWLVVVAVWLSVAAVIAVAARGLTNPRQLFAAVAAGQALLFFAGQVMIDGHLTMRYAYTPALFAVAALCALLVPRLPAAASERAGPKAAWRSESWRIAPVLGFALVLGVASGVNFRSSNDGRPPWDVAVATMRSQCADPAMDVAATNLSPRSGWTIAVPCRRLR